MVEESFLLKLYSVGRKKNHPPKFSDIFSKRLGIFSPNCINVPIYAGLQIIIQLSALLTKLCHIKRDHLVHTTCSKCPPSAETYAGIFWHFCQTVWNFWSKFHKPIIRSYVQYIRLQISITTSNLTKLCHIKCDHPACVSADGGRYKHITEVALNMA